MEQTEDLDFKPVQCHNIYFGRSYKIIYSMDFIKTTSPHALNWSRRIEPRNNVLTARNDQPRNNVRTLCPSRLNARPSSHTNPGSIVPRSTNLKSHNRKPRTTAPREQEGNVPRPCSTTRVTRTITPSDQEGLVPRPAESFDQYHPSGRTRRMNEEFLGHDRPDRADSRSSPDSRPNVLTDRPNGPVDPKPFLKPVSHVSSPTT
ncbi:unnamed protein product [Microthlaspi erraticum]|uniref:Uncharacterized protein n=1 Tax=Microthlaspi erraticum TaxID=1685480 RepID=A0A6D2IVI1_9BRAS|nr:unnamed protein product [Microthlaspi erraticum]